MVRNAKYYLAEEQYRKASDSQQRKMLVDDPCFCEGQQTLSDAIENLRNEQRTTCFANLDASLSGKTKVALLVADMDRMRIMNDEFGFLAGDTVLFPVAQMFEKRFGDKFYQHGDQFNAFIAGDHVSKAQELAESIRLEVENLRIKDHPELKATISVGLAFSDNTGSTRDDLLRRAEDALWQAKRGGANCVRIYK